MDTKFGVQTLHSKYYLRIKPRCSGNFWSSKTNDSIGEIYWIFLRRLNPIVRKPVLSFFLKIKLTSVSRWLRGVILSTIRNFAYRSV